MKRTVQSIVEKYGVNRIHYSVIVFGSVAISHIDFSTSIPDRDELIRKVIGLPKSKDRPDLVKALEKAKQVFELQKVRPNAKKVLVVILDNASANNKRELKKAVHVLVNKSVLIIGVRVGSAVDPEQLEIITEEIRNVIRVRTDKNPDELAKEIMAIILRSKFLCHIKDVKFIPSFLSPFLMAFIHYYSFIHSSTYPFVDFFVLHLLGYIYLSSRDIFLFSFWFLAMDAMERMLNNMPISWCGWNKKTHAIL